MKHILVVDDMSVFREPIAFCLRGQGYAVACAGNGVEALAQLKTQAADLILLDIGMPVMDGLTFLKTLATVPGFRRPPVILLTAMGEKDYIIQAAHYGVRDYLLKSRFSLKDLLARVAERLVDQKAAPSAGDPATAQKSGEPSSQQPPSTVQAAAASASPAIQAQTTAATSAPTAAGSSDTPRLLTADKCLLRTQSAMSQMKLAGVASKLVALATSSGGGPEDLVSLLTRDKKFAGRVLQAVNVILATPDKTVTTLSAAVDSFGYSAIRDIATTSAIFDTMGSNAGNGLLTAGWWRHSMATATLCKRLLNGSHPGTEGAAYLTGLCHDLGEILFRTHFKAEYAQVIEACSRTGRNRDELERTMLGITSGQITQMILQDIGLPDTVRKSIALFYGEMVGKRTAGNEPLAKVLRMADAYASGLDLTPPEGSAISSFTRAYARNASGDEVPPSPDPAQFHDRVWRMACLLMDTPGAPSAPGVLSGEGLKVWLARDPLLSTFDPIAAALGSMCHLKISDRLPETSAGPSAQDATSAPSEIAGIDAVVVTSRSAASTGFCASDIYKLLNAQRETEMPILWLVERSDSMSGDETGPRPVVWPVNLERLARFVRESTPAAAARKAA